ncbi:hypothetical protein CC79DRAFT_1351149 [Sarocladium strictum]
MASTVDERELPNGTDSSSPVATNTADVPHTNPDESSEFPNLSSLKPIISNEPAHPKSDATPADSNALATRALEFLSTATPTTLSAVAVGFATVTYAVLGKLGLVLIGAFGGVVGFISWQARNPQIAKIVQGEKGLNVVERLLHDLDEKNKDHKPDAEDDESTLKSFDDFRPETKDALAGLVDATIRDYVKWWYSPIVPSDHSFPLACRKVLTTFLIGISNHLYRKRPADAFLDLLTNSSSMMIVFMSELASAFADLPPDSKMTAADAVYNYLAANPNSNLANLLNQKQQGAKFKMISEDMLGFLEQSSYNCSPARIFLREILANSVFEMMLQKCSKADYINAWIVYLLEDGEPDISQAIDVGMQTGRDAGSNVFADIDGNVGNVGLARPPQRSSHKKQLSRAEEEMDEAMEEMKRMNALIVKEQEARRKREASISEENRPLRTSGESDAAEQGKTRTPGDESPTSAKSEAVPTPATPLSTSEYPSPVASPLEKHHSHFTNFDQIVPQPQPNEEEEQKDEKPVAKKAPLTLHNASFTLHDDISGDTAKIRMKPTWDYLIQVEPSSTDHSGWMIVRRYSDFETLHEILRRIAQISGATAFTELHKELPLWKIHTRESLRGELERYLRDACWYQALAESEGMRRFLEKSQGHTHTNSKSFGWETVSKNMLEGLTTAPKGLMEGSKTLVGGVTGVFGNFPGLVKRPSLQSSESAPNVNRLSISTPPRMDSMRSPARSERASMDSQRSSVISTQPGKMAPMERRPSYQSQGEDMGEPRMGRHDRMESVSVSGSARQSREHSRAPSGAPLRSPSTLSLLDQLRLPPHPDEVGDDFEWSADGAEIHPKPLEKPIPSPAPSASAMKLPPKPARQHSQFTEPETRVAVELMFAVINEMYTLSSAWNIRRTLLTAAKSFLLRPGNPSLLNVQNLIQDSIIDGNTSDAAIAAQLRKLRENTMPTEQERAAWPAEATDEEKEKLRVKARALIIRSGVPAALMGVMGQAATGEALGRVFDCLQIEEVARGLFFGLMLQAVRIVTH